MKYYQETRIVFLLLIVVMFSCQRSKHRIVKEYYSTGEIFKETSFLNDASEIKEGVYKEYYKNGQVKKILNFKNNIPCDSSLLYDEKGELKFKEVIEPDTIYAYHFYSNGNVLSKSKFLNLKNSPLKIGWEEFFNIDGSVNDSIQYINVNDSSLLNQRKKINNKGEIIKDSSFYYNMKISKILDTENYQLNIQYVPANKSSDVFLVIGEEINDVFSNIRNVKLDTLIMNNNVISTNSLKKNHRHLKGFFLEYERRLKDVHKDSVKVSVYERKVFFNNQIVVTDTIK